MNRTVRVFKRIIDIVTGLIGTVVFLIAFPFIGTAIRLASPGPILFRQTRAGRLLPPGRGEGGPRFSELRIRKFRTMRVDAERFSQTVLLSAGDPRVTNLGRFLRRSRLDELPQFINVLVGDMSLVGPRPERPELCELLLSMASHYEHGMRGVKPGLTGLAQVNALGGAYYGIGLAVGLSPALRRLPPDALVLLHRHGLPHRYRLPYAGGAFPDEMRVKMLCDLSYAAAMRSLSEYLRLELQIIAKTPLMILRRMVN